MNNELTPEAQISINEFQQSEVETETVDLNDFQVVRREFFAHLRDPAVYFDNYRFRVNCACLRKYDGIEYIQVLVNRESKTLLIRPCGADDRDAFQWCRLSNGKYIPREVTCRLFFAKMFSMMGWNTRHRYKLLGRPVHANGEDMLAFDLNATEVYQRLAQSEDKKSSVSKVPVFPESWREQFGPTFSEHQESLRINTFDGYAVYSIREISDGKVSTVLADKSIPDMGGTET